jgi:hypothetical protein
MGMERSVSSNVRCPHCGLLAEINLRELKENPKTTVDCRGCATDFHAGEALRTELLDTIQRQNLS